LPLWGCCIGQLDSITQWPDGDIPAKSLFFPPSLFIHPSPRIKTVSHTNFMQYSSPTAVKRHSLHKT
jgi:hypothetical protein